jgi:hypothetical protein
MQNHLDRGACGIERGQGFPCDRDDCKNSFDTKSRLNDHIAEVHDWEARGCDKDGCNPSHVFQSRSEYSKHIAKDHSSWEKTTSQYPGCKSQVSFASSKTYRSHLQDVHRLTDRKEKDKYIPGKKPAFVRQTCRLADCASKENFTQASKLRDHLVLKHGYTVEAVESYMSLSGRTIQHQKNLSNTTNRRPQFLAIPIADYNTTVI